MDKINISKESNGRTKSQDVLVSNVTTPCSSISCGMNLSGISDFLLSHPLYRTFIQVHISELTITTRYLSRAAPSPLGYSPKSIIQPKQCILLQNHYCAKRVLQATAPLNVDVKFATSNHFKKCHLLKSECMKMMNDSVIDDVMLKYSENLVVAVYRQYKNIAPKFKNPFLDQQ